MADQNDTAEDMPLDEFVAEMAKCGYKWVKRIGHVNVHIFEHEMTHDVMPIPAERGIVRATYVAHARKRCREIQGNA